MTIRKHDPKGLYPKYPGNTHVTPRPMTPRPTCNVVCLLWGGCCLPIVLG